MSLSSDIASAAKDIYDLSFQISPIIFKNGIASGVPGKLLPIIALGGQAGSALLGAISSGGISDNDFFATYLPVPGHTVINNAIGNYPFANQLVAANAIIQQPNVISMLMMAPVKTTGGYLTKLALFTSLIMAFQNHNNQGGSYIIATPAFIYTDCVMTSMTNVSGGDTKQQQTMWQLDFQKPLITAQDAAVAVNGLMSKLTSGQQTTSPGWSGANAAPSPTGAQSAISGVAGSIVNFGASPI